MDVIAGAVKYNFTFLSLAEEVNFLEQSFSLMLPAETGLTVRLWLNQS